MDDPHSHRPVPELAQKGCMLEGMTQLLGDIHGDFLVVLHADADCANLVSRPSHAADPTRFYCTNLGEKDLILGSANTRLERLVRALDAHRPTPAIFLVGSCATSLIGEDMDAAAQRLQPGITTRLIPVEMHAFQRSGQAEIIEGFTRHLGRLAVPRDAAGEAGLNLIGFPEDGGATAALLRDLGLRVNTALTLRSPLQEWGRLVEGTQNVVSDARLFRGLLTALQEEHALPWVEAPSPWGLEATVALATQTADALGEALPAAALALHVDPLRTGLAHRRAATTGRRLAYHVGARKDFAEHTVVREGLAPLAFFEELGFHITLLFQGAPEEGTRQRVAAVLRHLHVEHPFEMAPDRVSLTRILGELGVDLFYGCGSLHEEVGRARVPHLPIGTLRPGLAGCEAGWRRVAELLPAAEDAP